MVNGNINNHELRSLLTLKKFCITVEGHFAGKLFTAGLLNVNSVSATKHILSQYVLWAVKRINKRNCVRQQKQAPSLNVTQKEKQAKQTKQNQAC